ncbi:MAG: OmpA family protein [Deltaproteobacteria bacterium]|nr:OmpA family protein [Deltaproteobacteria bacterium]
MVKFFKSLSLLCFFVVMIPHGAQAYEVDIQLFKPATGTGSLWSTESAQMGKHLGYRAGLQLQYARDPLVLSISQSAGSQGEVGALVANRFDAALTLTVALWEWVEVGLSVPLILQGGAEGEAFDAAGLEVGLGALSAVSVGDIRVVPRSKLFGLGDGALDVAVGVGVVLPSGSAAYAGEGGVSLEPALYISSHKGLMTAHINAGFRYRKPATIETLTISNEIFWNLGASVDLIGLQGEAFTLSAVGEFFGRTDASEPFGIGGDENSAAMSALTPMGFMAGARMTVDGTWSVGLGAGGGMHPGYGTAAPRLMMELSYNSAGSMALDTDGDGLSDDRDECISKPEDLDGFEDDDGCPDSDNDGDMVLDEDDACPNDPEDRDGIRDDDGCPDVDDDGDGVPDETDKCPGDQEDLDGFQDEDGCADFDNDGDGFADGADRCPMEAEDLDGFQDEDGCPDLDNDLDGVPDLTDACPLYPEDLDGVEDTDGCAEDNDRDGILDALDKCPLKPETYNFESDTDGCPDKGKYPAYVSVGEGRLEFQQPVAFKYRGLKLTVKGKRVLLQVAAIIKAHKHWTKILVVTHVNSLSSKRKNQKFSKTRAAVVERFLKKQGISSDRLVLVPRGSTAGEKSDRVDFVVEEEEPLGTPVGNVTEPATVPTPGIDFEMQF